MNQIIFSAFLFIYILNMSLNAQAQSSSPSRVKVMTCGNATIFSDGFNTEFKMWYNLQLIVHGDTSIITNLQSDETAFEFSVICSPNKKYFHLDNIIIGYLGDAKDSNLYTNYKCVIVSKAKHKVIYTMQSDCVGGWNSRSQWCRKEK